MKLYVMKEYVRIFNLPKWKILKSTERLIISFNDIVENMKHSEDEYEIVTKMFFCSVLIPNLNMNPY